MSRGDCLERRSFEYGWPASTSFLLLQWSAVSWGRELLRPQNNDDLIIEGYKDAIHTRTGNWTDLDKLLEHESINHFYKSLKGKHSLTSARYHTTGTSTEILVQEEQAFIMEHIHSVQTLLDNYGGTVDYNGVTFKIEMDKLTPVCEIDTLILTGSRFKTFGKFDIRFPVLYV